MTDLKQKHLPRVWIPEYAFEKTLKDGFPPEASYARHDYHDEYLSLDEHLAVVKGLEERIRILKNELKLGIALLLEDSFEHWEGVVDNHKEALKGKP